MQKLASAASLEDLKSLIAQFYYAEKENITIDNAGAVYNNARKLSTKAKKINKRFVFYFDK